MIEQPQQSLQTLQQSQSDLLRYCDNISITSITEQKRVEELNAELNFAVVKVENLFKYQLEPILEAEKRTRGLFKPYIDKLKGLQVSIRKSLSDWHDAQGKITETEINQRAQEFWDKQKDAQKTGIVVPLPDLNVSPPSKTSHHNMGTTSYRKQVFVKIINPKLIPRQYCVPSESLLRKAGELGITDIEGAIIEVKHVPVTRGLR
jgi:hypothetical protein